MEEVENKKSKVNEFEDIFDAITKAREEYLKKFRDIF